MDNNELKKYYDLFMMSTMLVLNIVMESGDDNIVASNSCTLYDAIENMQFDMTKTSDMIKKIYIFITKNYQYIKLRDRQLFTVREMRGDKQVKITIIPGIDIDIIYDKLSSENQCALWEYIDMLYYSSIKMISLVKNFSNSERELLKIMEERVSEEKIHEHFYSKNPNSKIYKKADTFNPYIGIGENNTNYGINEMANDMNTAVENSGDSATYGISSMVSLLGLDKMLGIDQLADQLKNIDPKDIEEAGAHIKKLLGDNIDEGTSEMINMMLHDITNEFKKDGLSGDGNPMENIIKLAGNVANKMIPKIDPTKINVDKIWESTQNLANNCTNQYGEKMNGKDNPLSMLTNLMSKQMEQAKKGAHGEKINKKQQSELMNEYQNVMKKMGMDNINMNGMQDMLNNGFTKNTNTGRAASSPNTKKKYKNKK